MSRTITAMFDDRSHAEAAVQQLIRELRLDSTRVHMHAADATVETTRATTQDTGFWASLKDLFVPEEDRTTYVEGVRRGAIVVSAQLDEKTVDYAMDILEQHGAVDLESREAEWRQQGWTGAQVAPATSGMATASSTSGQGVAASGTTTATHTAADRVSAHTGGEEVIPIAEEKIRVGKRDVERGRVRVRSYVVETPVTEQVTLREEHVDVQRRAADRPVTDADVLFQDRTIEATESAEEAVVAKEARITGEVVIRKDASERTETVQDTVRRTEVDVDNTAGAASHTTEGAVRTDTTTTNPPGTAASRAMDETAGSNVSGAHPHQADGTPGNPPGTMASRAVDKTLDTNISGANPGKR
jgi:uncharacterized protein (TIGR02271 family)